METPQRKIIHIDMDAFYASVEQRDFPQYRNKPVIVGGKPGDRGVVAACSYEARQFGIHSAMPSITAYKHCPHAIFVKPRFDAYRQCSQQIRQIFQEYTEIIEPLSLDEAYLDVSNAKVCKGSATLIAKDIKSKIKSQLNLIASAGVSYNKFLAKMASDMDKPDGLSVILPGEAKSILESLDIRKFYGIGKATETKMKRLGISDGKALKNCSQAFLTRHFGKYGLFYYYIVRGEDSRPVNTSSVRKSIGAETTFSEDIVDINEIMETLERLNVRVIESLTKYRLLAQTITLKVKYRNFVQCTRSQTLSLPFDNENTVMQWLPILIARTDIGTTPIRLVGVTLSSFTDKIVDDTYQQRLL